MAPPSSCTWSHDIDAYLASKEGDVFLPPPPSLPSSSTNPVLSYGSLHHLSQAERTAYLDEWYSTSAPFVTWSRQAPTTTTTCPLYHCTSSRQLWSAIAPSTPFCPFGFRCRFLSSHVVAGEGEENGRALPWGTEEGDMARRLGDESNYARPTLYKELRLAKKNQNRKDAWPLTWAIQAALEREDREYQTTGVDSKGTLELDPPAAPAHTAAAEEEDLDALANGSTSSRLMDAATSQSSSSVDRARTRRSEKRRLNWHHHPLYLAPLTTVGNLPFRRLCTTYGADITCGEMGLASSYLDGVKSEWSLPRRWEGEKTFGVQLCGSKPELLVPTAEVMAREFGAGLDFVDINCGCPIDLVFKQGAGSALLDHPRKLGRIVRGMDAALGEVPVTVKLRTGITEKRTSHARILPRVQTEWGAAAVTMHGRSRKQRYSKRADWDYIKECAHELRESVRVWNEESRHADEEEMQPIPVSARARAVP